MQGKRRVDLECVGLTEGLPCDVVPVPELSFRTMTQWMAWRFM